ncbi:MAG: GMC family oxidoreductase [Myxococcales bacterium]|nr:GMC family oxidoreductase [Myxococcales bacterium]MCB9524734.1 GMC family oxidoreductase [Myxococcales bacterium]
MSHIAFQPKGQRVDVEADYVVVGSGAGGAAAASVLARAGYKVAIVEAGPWRAPQDYPSTTYGAMRDLFDNWGLQVALGKSISPVVQARCVGGTTVINSAICVRTPGDIFRQWAREWGVPEQGLSASVWRHQDDLEQELCAELVPPASRGRSTELALEAAEKLGFKEHHVMTRYVKGCQGSGQCLQGCRNLTKQSTNVNLVPEVRARGGVVLSCAPVDKVVMKRGEAVGVTGRFIHPGNRSKGAGFFVRARKGVFVAASATYTPVILMRSGIRHPKLGHFFRAHPGAGVFGVYDEPIDMNVGATQGWASIGFRDSPGIKLETLAIPPEMIASRLSGGGTALMSKLSEYRHLAMWVHSIRAETAGRVRNLGGKPFVTYSLDLPDMHRLRAGLYLTAQMHFAAGAKAIIPGIHGLPYKLGPDDLELIKHAPLEHRRYITIMTHLFGGAVMGGDPRTSVCDPTGKVRGTRNLFVSDAAAIPTVLGVNPQHTIMGLARHFAERQVA